MKRVVSPSKVVEQWDLEIYTLILLWRYVRRGERKKKKKNKIETGRPLFPRPRILVKISRTLRGGDPPSKTFTYDLFGGPLDHPLSLQTRRFLGFKRILRDYAPARFPYFSEPATFFFFPFPLSLREIVTWCRHGDFSSKTNLSTWSIGQATTIRCIIQQYFISDPRYSFLPRLPLLLSVHGDPVFVYVCIW